MCYTPLMPRHTEWIQHLPQAITELRALPSPTIDRRTLQSLLHISPRHAIRILSFLGAYSAGKSLLIERETLIQRLETVAATSPVQWEQRRHERVGQHLDRYRKEQHARTRKIQVPSTVAATRIASLPPGVSILPGTLSIGFASAEDLLAKLFALAQAISNDYAAFEAAIAPPHGID